MGIRILKGGMLTTMQDIGRTGYQSQGFPVAGVMDVRSFKIANLLSLHQKLILSGSFINGRICTSTNNRLWISCIYYRISSYLCNVVSNYSK